MAETQVAATPRVRELSRYDFPDLHRLLSALSRDNPVPEGPTGEAILYEILAMPGTSLFGAECEGRIVATAMLSILPNLTYGGRPLARIENVVTLPDYRGRGFASAVMTAAIDKARAKNCADISLLSPKSFHAEGFYRKLGFKDDTVGLHLFIG
ncbi:GNAT family N-acetyltransferase [Maritimibacter sp. DP1N21-5]|uniref:GNAT family N-acetyltransferase n=1 Tax=Maritimibacter sp. DP1N21-5 TaxID=2836867 RepID=UPI001C44E827|nr:GNAT family N-acetyltransferase [Maritimibacter sp. DP1N21-5]MBV7409368.1 GNAT family N-acetyltransferase [Maritimibacter sp. DP1N21-5]